MPPWSVRGRTSRVRLRVFSSEQSSLENDLIFFELRAQTLRGYLPGRALLPPAND